MMDSRHILGLAIDDRGAVATELHVHSGRAEIWAAGELIWKQELTADNAAELGDQLRRFLRDKGFSSRRVIVGLAAKWVLAREIDVPPADPEALAGLLGIQAERAFAINAGELIFDYCGRTSATEKRRVLLFAAPRDVVERIRALTEAAGLRLESLTVSALACGKALSGAGPACRYGLYARPTYCEFWDQSDDGPRFVRHVPLVKDGTPADYTASLTSTIQRLILLSSGQGQSPPHRIAAYNACGLSHETVRQVNELLGPQIAVHDACAGLLSKGVRLSDRPEAMHSIAAAAVAMTVMGTDKPPVDFLNPRIGEHRASGRKRIIAWAGGVAAVCFLSLGITAGIWRSNMRAVAAYRAELEGLSGDVAAAREMVDRVAYARSWTSRQPHFLDYLRELTQAFPDEGSVWVTSLALNPDDTGSVVGKTRNEASFYAVLDKIRENKTAFSDVTMTHIRNAGRDSQEKEFQITLVFRGAK
jgi:hypothetical protein